MMIELYVERQKFEGKKIEYAAWLNGLYVMRAIGSAFSKKVKYPNKPIVNEDDEENESVVVDETIEYTDEELAAMRSQAMEALRKNLRKRKKVE